MLVTMADPVEQPLDQPLHKPPHVRVIFRKRLRKLRINGPPAGTANY